MTQKPYSPPAAGLATAQAIGVGEGGRYILAATFGNVHGVYKPGHVTMRPSVLKEIQDAVGAKYGKDKPFDLVFHGGSGAALEEISEAISYGVVKMNVDTDTQYAFTRPVAGHMFSQYDGVLKLDGDVGRKKDAAPRPGGKAAAAPGPARVQHACEDLMSAGKRLPCPRAGQRRHRRTRVVFSRGRRAPPPAECQLGPSAGLLRLQPSA